MWLKLYLLYLFIYIYIYILETTKITHELSIQMSYYLWSSRLDLEDDSSKTIWSQTFSNGLIYSTSLLFLHVFSLICAYSKGVYLN